KVTCSRACDSVRRSVTQRGSLSSRWRGGKTSPDRRARNDVRTDRWRQAVFARDDFTCGICQARGGRLCADHILPWAYYPSLRWDVDNGRTLCRGCHTKLPTSGQSMLSLAASANKVCPDAPWAAIAFGAFMERPEYYGPHLKLLLRHHASLEAQSISA